jgi:hypothetical protein
LKRAPFLGAGAAAFLTGCGGNHLMRALPGVATLRGQKRPDSASYRLVPETAEAIPDYVLARPIVGEARRFDGAVAPLGWLLCQGQTLPVAENRLLFKVLGKIAGGDGKTTFNLPTARAMIIAAGGVFPSTAAVFTQSGRHMSHEYSLGEGARPAPLRIKKSAWEKTAAERQLMMNAVRAGRPAPVRLAQDVLDRIGRGREEARSAALERLSAPNRAQLEAAIPAIVDGRTTVYATVTALAGALSDGEANALLAVHDAMVRAFRDGSNEHRNPRFEAAAFLVPIAFTREQKRALLARESAQWRNG